MMEDFQEEIDNSGKLERMGIEKPYQKLESGSLSTFWHGKRNI
jgi:hypothetical protein